MTSVLLDTNALLKLSDPSAGALDKRAVRSIERAHVVYASAVSLWELAIKSSIGKLRLNQPAGEWFDAACRLGGLRVLPIALSDLAAVELLPGPHRDPFGRLLIVQAQQRRMIVVTSDKAFADYDVLTTLR